MNKAIGPGHALIDGHSTGLAPCLKDCPLPCLRSDPKLQARHISPMHEGTPGTLCRYFIPVEPA
jgi:hypothetical protein